MYVCTLKNTIPVHKKINLPRELNNFNAATCNVQYIIKTGSWHYTIHKIKINRWTWFFHYFYRNCTQFCFSVFGWSPQHNAAYVRQRHRKNKTSACYYKSLKKILHTYSLHITCRKNKILKQETYILNAFNDDFHILKDRFVS